MKRLLAVVILLGAAAHAYGAFQPKGWTWQRPVDVDDLSGFVRLSVTPETFDESQPTLNDLRVLDGTAGLVPHVIHWGRVQETRLLEWKTAQLLNSTFLPRKYARVTVDFGEIVEKNLLKVGLSGQNYRRQALLEGSNDTKTWEVVAENLWLLEVSLEGHSFMLDTLRFPPNNFRYLRLTVYHMADDPRRISIETVMAAFQQVEKEKELVSVPVKRQAVSHDEEKKQSTLELDLGFRNLPVSGVQFEIKTPYFYRGYELFGRNALKEKISRKTETRWDTVEQDVPWRSLHRGVLYRIREKTGISHSLKIDGLHAPCRFLKLLIFNGDNPPLQIEGASVFRRETSLVFEVKRGQTYALIGGNSSAGQADYDLSKAVQGVDEFTLPAVRVGSSAPIGPSKEKPAPWSERHSTLIWIVLGLAAAVMILVISKNLKKLAPESK